MTYKNNIDLLIKQRNELNAEIMKIQIRNNAFKDNLLKYIIESIWQLTWYIPESILNTSRVKELRYSKLLTIHVLRKYWYTYTKIANIFWLSQHNSIMYSYKQSCELYENNEQFKSHVKIVFQ